MFRYVRRSMLAIGLVLALASCSVAQYGGGGGGMGGSVPGSPTYNSNRSYGSKGAIIGGVAGGAALVGGLLYWKHHNRTKLIGCVAGNGDRLVSEADNQTYRLSNQHNEALLAGEHVKLLGKKTKDDTGEPTFEVKKMSKDLGKCSVNTAQDR